MSFSKVFTRVFFLSCMFGVFMVNGQNATSTIKETTPTKSEVDTCQIIKTIFDKYRMEGTMLIFDPSTGGYSGYNSVRWDSGYLPASTFKIPNTLIGLESGVIDTGFIFRWNGQKRRLTQWEKDLTLREAFRVSCVPCYQEIARKAGSERMQSLLDSLGYPGMFVTKENIEVFWLEGKSRITPRQQIEFLCRLHDEKLPLRPASMKSVKTIMINEVTSDYSLSGKTGWAVRESHNYGWFVGWLETKGNIYYIAILVEPKNQAEINDFGMARKAVAMEAFRMMGMIKGEKE